jgi:hypothetical protein
MDAGAHGGQVVCELGTAVQVLRAWGIDCAVERELQPGCFAWESSAAAPSSFSISSSMDGTAMSGEEQGKPAELARPASYSTPLRTLSSCSSDCGMQQQQQQQQQPGPSINSAPLIGPTHSGSSAASSREGILAAVLAEGSATAAKGHEPSGGAAAGSAAPRLVASQYHCPREHSATQAVEVHRLGMFRFKGSTDDVELVQVRRQLRHYARAR